MGSLVHPEFTGFPHANPYFDQFGVFGLIGIDLALHIFHKKYLGARMFKRYG